jgi:hypothetical protein
MEFIMQEINEPRMNFKKEIIDLKESVHILRENVHKLLGRNNDFSVKVINGKTVERLASELIGEMYVALKDHQRDDIVAIKELKKASPRSLWKNLAEILLPLVQIITLIGLIVTMFKVFS